MAKRYLHNNAVGTPASPWDTYGTNHAYTLVTFDAVDLSGDTIFVSNSHAEVPGATIVYTSGASATASAPQKLLCVSNIGTDTALVTSPAASIVPSGAYTTTFEKFWYIYGCIIGNSGSSSSGDIILGGTTSGPHNITLDTCKISTAASASAPLVLGAAGANTNDETQITLNNCVFAPNIAGVSIELAHGQHRIHNLSLDSGATAPTSLFIAKSAITFDALVENSDLSGLAFTNLFSSAGSISGLFRVRNLKIPTSCSVLCTDNITAPGMRFLLDDCSYANGDRIPYYRRYYPGEVFCERTILPNDTADRMYLAGDTTDYHSVRLVTGANASMLEPLYSDWFHFAIDDTGTAVTPYAEILVHGNAATALKDNETWIEYDEMVTATYRLGTRVTDAPTVIAAGTNQASGTIAWTGHGYASPTTHELATSSYTPAHKGYGRARIALAKPNTGIYIGKVGVK